MLPDSARSRCGCCRKHPFAADWCLEEEARIAADAAQLLVLQLHAAAATRQEQINSVAAFIHAQRIAGLAEH